MPRPRPRNGPHKLALYEAAVQHPLAEVDFLGRAYRHYFKEDAYLLREDFSGTAAVAAAWCASDPQRQAMGVDHHGPTVRWAQRRYRDIDDLHLVAADVLDVASPRVDVVAALNFSTLVWHTRDELVRYFKHARKCLLTRGVFVMDVYGGPGAQRPRKQTRRAELPSGERFTYEWEQRSLDPVTGRTDCRIHFELGDGTRQDNAFRYDWRLWSPPDLAEAMREAGFAKAEVWGPDGSASGGGRFRPVRRLPGGFRGEDWVVYVVGVRG